MKVTSFFPLSLSPPSHRPHVIFFAYLDIDLYNLRGKNVPMLLVSERDFIENRNYSIVIRA